VALTNRVTADLDRNETEGPIWNSRTLGRLKSKIKKLETIFKSRFYPKIYHRFFLVFSLLQYLIF
jgi:hypothetical protein